jgi:hypothetical protein
MSIRRSAPFALLSMLALLAIPAAADSASTQSASSPTAATLPPVVVALEQKMGQLHINSERYTLRTRGVTRITTFGKRHKRRTRTTHISTRGVGEVSLSPAAGRLISSGGGPSLIVLGSRGFIRFPDPKHHGRLRWVRSSGSIAPLFPFHGGVEPALEVDRGGTGSYAGLINVLATAVGAVSVSGPQTVDGQQVTEVTALVEPLALIKGLSNKELTALRKNPLRVRLDAFITESGLPIRVTETDETRATGVFAASTQTADITAVEVPVTVRAPPARDTISQAQFEKLNEKI